jgi:hypothetical protein
LDWNHLIYRAVQLGWERKHPKKREARPVVRRGLLGIDVGIYEKQMWPWYPSA